MGILKNEKLLGIRINAEPVICFDERWIQKVSSWKFIGIIVIFYLELARSLLLMCP